MESGKEMYVTIRKAGRKDLPEVLKLHEMLEDNPDSPFDTETAEALYEKMLTYPDYAVYVAELDGILVGTFELAVLDSLGHHGAPFGLLEDVVVSDRYRGRGIGKQMVTFAARVCSEKGCYKLALSSNRKRTDAHRFYESLGFSLHGYSLALKL
jgi:GNAT superfamily N-acetyltransferase